MASVTDVEGGHRAAQGLRGGCQPPAAEAAQLMRDHITYSLTATAISALEESEGHA
ncbi:MULTISPECIES: hypothetical protein [Streptomyces]|uniref:GntR family transcriptional regulator n=1 Tax=Streptomyces lonegramiae TaxID=3075524 RepID=A0ABU2X7K0_9ACTN|nr:hypothetical protein [Streptomyces sp. DSM 41529]MDT0541409.1 hypothetical protein [Streptomyces sp. DSM 41529]